MKYRIKIITYKNGRQSFYPAFRKWFVWIPIWYNGSLIFSVPNECATRDSALNYIDAHYAGSSKVQTIEFEYINK